MKQRLLILSLLFIALNSFAQKQGNTWYFGEYGGLDFNSGAPVPLTNGSLYTNEGSASISDKTTGALLFYTDGTDIWDRNHTLMPGNVWGLGGHYSSAQSAVIVPKPGSNTIYYVFTVDAQAANWSFGTGGLNYNIVDMSLRGGLGDVTVNNITLLTPTDEKVAAVKHCNGRDTWVLTHRYNSNAFYAYLVTSAGIGAPIISNSGITHQDVGSFQDAETIGYMKFSPNGKKLALACYIELNTIQIFDFNNSTGVVSNPATDTNFPNYTGSDGPYGVSFSPDNSRLYIGYFGYDDGFTVTSSKIYQYNMLAGSNAAIIASKTLIASEYDYGIGALQIGPDGKIYIAHAYYDYFGTYGSNYLSVINNPNALGNACNYVFNQQTLGGTGYNLSWWGLPDIIENFLVTPYTATLNYTGCNGNTTLSFTDYLNAPVTVSWNFGDPASGINNTSTLQNPTHTFSANGTYTVTVTISNSCTSNVYTQTITVGSFSISSNPDVTICQNGSATLTVTGAPSGSTYSWTPTTGLSPTTGSSVNASPSSTTIYTVTATNTSGCTASTVITVTVNPLPNVSINPSSVSLCGGQSVILTASGASTYVWTPSSGLSSTSSAVVTATPSGNTTYTVVGKDGNNCTSTATTTIAVSPAMNTSVGQTNVLCNGGTSGAASVNVSGGTSPYGYLWSNGQNTAPITNVGAGTYDVTVTDNIGCTTTASVTISEPTALNLTTSSLSVSCNGSCDAQASVIATGGASNYTYDWQPGGQSGPTATGLCPASYSVVVTDNNGCVQTSTAIVTEPVALALSVSSATIACNTTGGSASSTASGGTAPYAYAWSNSETTDAISGLVSGTYSLTVTDANGCSNSGSIIVNIAAAPVVTLSSQTNSTCFGTNNGSATAAVSGSSPFTYNWSPSGGTDATASGLAPGTYTIDITDNNGCTASLSVTVTEPPQINVKRNYGICEAGSVMLGASGGAGATYTWSPSAGLSDPYIANPIASPIVTTTYTVTIVNGPCTDTAHVTVTMLPDPVAPNIVQNGDTLSVPQVYATYQWYYQGITLSGANSYYYVANQTGYYSVFLTDTNGCRVLSSSVYITLSVANAFSDKGQGIKVFPNPAINQLTVWRSVDGVELTIELHNILGEIIYRRELEKGQQQADIDVTSLAAGMYVVQVNSSDKVYRAKVVVEK